MLVQDALCPAGWRSWLQMDRLCGSAPRVVRHWVGSLLPDAQTVRAYNTLEPGRSCHPEQRRPLTSTGNSFYFLIRLLPQIALLASPSLC